MAKPAQAIDPNFAFYTHLYYFYLENKGKIRRQYKEISKRFLDYNNPENANSFLRRPQFEALEIYIFLKEYLDNAKLHVIFKEWTEAEGNFENRRKLSIFDEAEEYAPVFELLRKQSRTYPNYIFALTMGTGKTILMATCIFYEFILGNKFPKDKRFCHNALVFAPDKTVLQSLREIEELDKSKVIPPEYASFLDTHLKFHFLDESGATLSTIDRSRFNLIVSNTQKIILKKQHTESTAIQQIFNEPKATTADTATVYDEANDLWETDEIADEISLSTNQRFEKISRLEQLGIYVDEAHHAFGTTLAQDMGAKSTKTSLRNTIDELAARLEYAGTHVVACYNYTGTPYIGNTVLPEVVYAYGLKEAIDNKYLKLVKLHDYTSTKSSEFIDLAITDFIEKTQGLRPENTLPKLAIFAATIEELQQELRPAVEAVLIKHNIPTSRILVNVGDEKVTNNDDIREFNRLDQPRSEKQFILLVNKGREGWNCRSLFGVALFREPKSKVFVLQATMRCLRAIGDIQYTGQVYLSKTNRDILENELKQNFRISGDELQNTNNKDKESVEVKVELPPVTIKLRRIHRQYLMQPKVFKNGLDLGLADIDTEPYKLYHTQQSGFLTPANKPLPEDLTHLREKRTFSHLTLIAEIARYLNKPCLEVNKLLESTKEGIDGILDAINAFNEILYDYVIPRLFAGLYDLTPEEKVEEYPVELVKIPADGYYKVTADKTKIVRKSDSIAYTFADKSFHLDTYCFDSNPEQRLFWDLLKDKKVKKLYFTGMLTHGQTDFYVQYIDPDSHSIRSYYPDFLFQKEDGTYVIVEVKGDNKIDDPVVLAKKQFAEQMATASGMSYKIIKGSDVETGNYDFLLNEDSNTYDVQSQIDILQ
jgi:hypothetical protein